MSFLERVMMRGARLAWSARARTVLGRCPACRGQGTRRVGYERVFLECEKCGFLWCHDEPEWAARRGMGLSGSWGGPERGGERDDFLVRFLNANGTPRQRVLLYGTGTTLVFRVLHQEGFDVYGADVSDEVVAYRATEFPKRFLHATSIERSAGAFDIITACEVFEHLHDPHRWLGALVRNLTPTGALCGSTNFYPGFGPIEDNQAIGYMSLGGHVAYWSERSLATALARDGLETVFFELVCPGSVKPDLGTNSLFPNKRLFISSRDTELIEHLRTLREREPVLPCDTSDYPVAAYRSAMAR